MTTTVTALNRSNRELTASSFADITTAPVLSIVAEPPQAGDLPPWAQPAALVVVTFDADLTAREQYEVRRRIRATAYLEALEERAIDAWQAIEDFNNLTIPAGATQAQINKAIVDELKLVGNVVQAMMETMFPEARTELLGG